MRSILLPLGFKADRRVVGIADAQIGARCRRARAVALCQLCSDHFPLELVPVELIDDSSCIGSLHHRHKDEPAEGVVLWVARQRHLLELHSRPCMLLLVLVCFEQRVRMLEWTWK